MTRGRGKHRRRDGKEEGQGKEERDGRGRTAEQEGVEKEGWKRREKIRLHGHL